MGKFLKIKSVHHFIHIVLALEGAAIKKLQRYAHSQPLPFPNSRLWYRGEPKDYGPTRLTPEALRDILRQKNPERLDPYKKEGIYVYYGTRVYQHKIGDYLRTEDLLETLIFLQHHGAPTRLLDWTLNPLLALYFAASEDFDEPGYVYVLNPRLLNHKQPSFGKYFDKLLIPSEDSINTLARLAFIIQDFAVITEKETELEIWTEFMKRLAAKVGKKFDLLRLAKEVCEAISKTKFSYEEEEAEAFCKGRLCAKLELPRCSDEEVYQEKTHKIHKKVDEFFRETLEIGFLDVFSTPIAFFPKWSFQRMQRQLSVFTLHGGFSGAANPQSGHTTIPKRVDEVAASHALCSIEIPPEKKEKIIKDLYYLGVNKHTLYSDDVGEGVKYLKFFLFDEPLGI